MNSFKEEKYDKSILERMVFDIFCFNVYYNKKVFGVSSIMARIEFVKDPGYTYDLFHLFMLNFNTELMYQDVCKISKSNSDVASLSKLLTDFGPFSNDLLPFFYIRDNNVSFISLYYYGRHVDRTLRSYSLSTVLEEISDFEQVITNAFHYYFEQITDDEISECKQSPIALHRLIKNSQYSSEVKSSLYSLFLEPNAIIQKLIDELLEKERLLSQYYQEASEKLSELQKDFALEEVLTNLENTHPTKANYRAYTEFHISFSLFAYYLVFLQHNNEKVLLTLGSKYDVSFRELLNDKYIPELHMVGNALAEPNRIDILNLILEEEEVTIRDIEQKLGFSGTNAYYHLSLMIKANIIKSRNSGKPVYYSINRRGFDEICKQLSKFSTKKGEISN